MPVLLAGCEPNDVPGTDFLNRSARALRPAAPRRNDKDLTQGMCMPGRARSWLECDACSGNPGRIGRLK